VVSVVVVVTVMEIVIVAVVITRPYSGERGRDEQLGQVHHNDMAAVMATVHV
jgi:hypothetical protein